LKITREGFSPGLQAAVELWAVNASME